MEKLTQRKAIEWVLANCELPKEIEEKIESVKLSMEKKSASVTSKAGQKQKKNEELRKVLLDILADNPQGLSNGELIKELDSPDCDTTSKMNALINPLKGDGTVERIKEGKKVIFKKVV